MLFHVEMAVNIPHNLDQDYVNDLKAKEKAMSQALQRSGKWLDIWRIVGRYANISLFEVDSHDELHEILSNLPLFPFMDVKVTPLSRHYSSIKGAPAPSTSASASAVLSVPNSSNGHLFSSNGTNGVINQSTNVPGVGTSKPTELMTRNQLDALLQKIESTESSDPENGGNERVKAIVNRIVRDLFYTIEDLNVQPDEFWAGIAYLTRAGQQEQWGLIAPGLGFEHLLDLRMDEADTRAGLTGGTPRTIEGPLYVAGAPTTHGFARLDDGTEEEKGELLFMQGQVCDLDGNPVPNALVEVWHANLNGFYSFFGPEQTPFNLRRGIYTDEQGRYQFRSIIPSGYSVPPDSASEEILNALGRHGHRPAHIHFFVSAPGYRKLTTQINIEDDPFLWDDFAFATREGLVPSINRIDASEAKTRFGFEKKAATIDFNFDLQLEKAGVLTTNVERVRKEVEEAVAA